MISGYIILATMLQHLVYNKQVVTELETDPYIN